MQASSIGLFFPSTKPTKSYTFPGTDKCGISDLTFETLIGRRLEKSLPCMILRIKDLAGKTHLFEGCSAEALGCLNYKKGLFKNKDGSWERCSSIQSFKLVQHNKTTFCFMLDSTNSFYLQHANHFRAEHDNEHAIPLYHKVLQKDPTNSRALVILGETYASSNPDLAKSYLLKAKEQGSEHAAACLEKLEQPEEEEVQVIAQAVQQLSIEEPRKPTRTSCFEGCQVQ